MASVDTNSTFRATDNIILVETAGVIAIARTVNQIMPIGKFGIRSRCLILVT